MLPIRFLWPVRTTLFVLVGVFVFYDRPAGAGILVADLVTYLTAGVAVLIWAIADLHPVDPRLRARALPLLFGAIVLSAGVGFSTGHGDNGWWVILTFLATAASGMELSLMLGWFIAAIGVVAMEVSWIWVDSGSVENHLLLPLTPVAGLMVGWFEYTRKLQAKQTAALLDKTRELQEEQRRTDVLGERARIAREIHDILAHSLGALGIQIQAARAVLIDHQDIDKAVETLAKAQRMAADGLTETRHAVHALRTDMLPVNEELAKEAEQHRDRYGVDVSFGVIGKPRPMPPDAAVALLRTGQEALANAAKHAQGKSVEVRLDYGDHGVTLTVVNDIGDVRSAKPKNGTVNGGYGLTGMRERLRLLNGTLAVGPRERQWAVTAELPLASAGQS